MPSNGASNPGTSNPLIQRDQQDQALTLSYQDAVWSATLADQTTEFQESRISDARSDQTEQDQQFASVSRLINWKGVELLAGADYRIAEFSGIRGGSNRPIIQRRKPR